MKLLDIVKFKHCPRCGEASLRQNDTQSIVCLSCNFVYYLSPSAAAVGMIEHKGKIIITKRAKEPHKGKFSLPGGFVHHGESLEEALIREIHEELNLVVSAPVYLCSHGGKYLYLDMMYFTTIAYFTVKADDLSKAEARDDIDEFVLVHPYEISDEILAFKGDRSAVEEYRKIANPLE